VLSAPYQLTVASDAPPGKYQLIVALYVLETGERLPVQGDGDTVTLRKLEIIP
jgi:hypothetical protein